MSKFHTLFPQVIYHSDLEGHSNFKKAYAEPLIKKYRENPTRQTWAKMANSWAYGVEPGAADDILAAVNEKIKDWFNHFKYGYMQYNIEAWWTVHKSEMYQETHIHTGHPHGFVFLCGVYYLQLSELDNGVVFMNANEKNHPAQLVSYGLPMAHPYYLENTCNTLVFEEGDIVLFNPDQPHFAPAAKKDHDGYRISLAFNVTCPFDLIQNINQNKPPNN